MTKYNINIEKTYRFCSNLSKVNYNNKILVIDPLGANWIVLDTLSQLAVFEYFEKGYSIEEVIKKSDFCLNDISYVVTQIEARKLCTKQVHKVTDEHSLHIYLTNQCNLACSHCYMFSGKANLDELTTDEIIKLLNDFKNIANGKRVTISGGEPAIHCNFDKIIITAAELGLEVKVLTNGTLLSPKQIALLANYISSVQISIDGYSEESNSIIRGKGHFSKALIALDELLKYNIETSIAMTPPLSLLQSHIDEYVAFAKELLESYANKPFQIKFAEEISNGRNITPSKKYNEKYSNLIKTIQKKIYNEDYDLINFILVMRQNIIMDNCMFGNFSVASNGDVYFCPEISTLPAIANIRTTTFKDIYISSLKAQDSTSVSMLKPCNKCNLCYICGGGCRTKEFPVLANKKSFEEINYNDIPLRNCNSKIKEKFYDLMIRSNEYLYISNPDD